MTREWTPLTKINHGSRVEMRLPTTYTEGAEVDELNEHNNPDGQSCKIRRGKIIAIYKNVHLEKAYIKCECGTMVTESV